MFKFKQSVLTAPVIMLCGLMIGIGQAMAGPKPDQVARLSDDLTPMGSERAGNAAGTIPSWTGGITEPPAGYSPGDHHPDPFADDQPLFRIDSSGGTPLRSALLNVGRYFESGNSWGPSPILSASDGGTWSRLCICC